MVASNQAAGGLIAFMSVAVVSPLHACSSALVAMHAAVKRWMLQDRVAAPPAAAQAGRKPGRKQRKLLPKVIRLA